MIDKQGKEKRGKISSEFQAGTGILRKDGTSSVNFLYGCINGLETGPRLSLTSKSPSSHLTIHSSLNWVPVLLACVMGVGILSDNWVDGSIYMIASTSVGASASACILNPPISGHEPMGM